MAQRVAYVEQPASDRAWHIEANGINTIPDTDRHGSATELFWVWCGANIGILGIVYGGIILAFGLSVWQALLVAALGSLSFVIVGILGVAGARTGAPMLTISRAVFGIRGNVLPALVSWIDLLGWETVNLLVSTYALVALIESALHMRASVPITLLALVLAAVATFAFSLLGHATTIRIQQICSWTFGILTLGVIVLLAQRIQLQALLHVPPGSWTHGFLPALSIIIAGTALGWTNTAADYTRYLPRNTRSGAIIAWTTLGSFVPLFALIGIGICIGVTAPGIATTDNPLAAIAQVLPGWVAVPYFFTAVGGLVAGNVLASYSSGLNLLAMFVRVKRYKTILIDAAVALLGSLYVLLVAPDFLGVFTTFLTLLAAGLAPWAAIMLVDMGRRRMRYDIQALYTVQKRYRSLGGVNPVAIVAWLLGVTLSLFLASTPVFSGPLATGIFQGSSLGFLAGAGASAILYALLWPLNRRLGASASATTLAEEITSPAAESDMYTSEKQIEQQ